MVENEFVRARQADPEFQVDLFHLWLTLARYKLKLLLSKTRALNSSQCRYSRCKYLYNFTYNYTPFVGK